MPLAPEFKTYDRQQPTYETKNPVELATFGPTVRIPLGRIVLGRSGDKCSDCNAGFFVRHDDEWDWLRSFLTVAKLRELMGPEEDKGKPIDRFEMPHIRAVHFLLHDHLDRGYDACSTLDTLGKNFMEYILRLPPNMVWIDANELLEGEDCRRSAGFQPEGLGMRERGSHLPRGRGDLSA